MYFQDLMLKLLEFWGNRGCIVLEPYDVEVGAGTMSPHTFLRALGPEPWKVVYVEPSRRPADARYGENPHRVYQHHQLQVILKPSPEDVQDIYLDSLRALGIDPLKHDIRFVEDNWESPTLGARGLGWEVWLDGMEITQFTYFQQVGGYEVKPVTVEITYGLERLAMYLQEKEYFYDLVWVEGVKYGDIYMNNEIQQSKYNYEESDINILLRLFTLYEEEAKKILKKGLVFPAYDYTLKCSHVFNLLDARGAISVSERTRYIGRIRELAQHCAKNYLSGNEDRSDENV